jgi:putative transposase
MISASDREEAVKLIDEAVNAGARQIKACQELGLNVRTLQRWRLTPADKRAQARREAPANKLSEAEREAVLATANSPEYASLTPHQIVPKLADSGIYLASESTFYRVLRTAGQNQRRGRARAPRARRLTTHVAQGPNQVWCWDITWLPSTVRGRYFYWADRRAPTGAAFGQWLRDEGGHPVGGDVPVGRRALVQPAASEQRQRLCRSVVPHRKVLRDVA